MKIDLTSKQLLGWGNREAAFSYGNPTYRKREGYEFLCQLEKESFHEAEWPAAEEDAAGDRPDGKVPSMWQGSHWGEGSPCCGQVSREPEPLPGKSHPGLSSLPCLSLFPSSPVILLPFPFFPHLSTSQSWLRPHHPFLSHGKQRWLREWL